MADKRARAKLVKEIEALCLRCPDSKSASECPASKSDAVAGCKSTGDIDDLWPGFSNGPQSVQNDSLDLSNSDQCLQLLKDAVAEDKSKILDAKKINKKSPPEMFSELEKLRKNYTYTHGASDGQTTFTKTVLGAAYETVYPAPAQELAQPDMGKKAGKKPAPTAARVNEGTLKFVKKPQSTEAPKQGVNLITNYFIVKMDSKKTLYQYQIEGLQSADPTKTLSSPKKNTIIRRMIEIITPQLHAPRDSFSFNNEGKIIAWTPLGNTVPEDTVLFPQIAVPDYDRTSNGVSTGNFTLRIVFKRTVNFQGLDDFVKRLDSQYEEVGASQALDIMFGNNIAQNCRNGTVQIGDNRFFPIGEKKGGDFDLSKKHGLIALRGFSSHVTPVDGNVALNVNTAFSAFFKQQTVAKYIEDFGGRAPNHLLHARVRILYDRCKADEPDRSKDTEARRTKTITGFSTKSARDINFTDRHGKKVTVWSHFCKEYPTAKSNAAGSICVNTGDTTTDRECWFLADQLEVLSGQLYRKTLDKLNSEIPAKMIDFACQSPEANRNAIMTSGLKALGLDSGTPPLLSNAGIEVAEQMMTIPFRHITPPKIIYKTNTKTNPLQDQSCEIIGGAWTTNHQVFCTTTQQIDGWVKFFSPSNPLRPDLEVGYVADFEKMYGANGIKFKSQGDRVDQQIGRIPDFTPGALCNLIKPVGLAILVLPEDNAVQRKNYANFRVAADQMLGKPSLVLSEKRIGANSKNLIPYMASNMMKVNVRLGNENHHVGAFGSTKANLIKGFLVLGADLVHPKQGCTDDVPSIASLVGSIDDNFATFYGSARRTAHRVEIIESKHMVEMATERIRAWSQANKKALPAKILYYRDGTGQSQYSDILNTEVKAIRDAFAIVKADRDTAIAAQKTKLQITAVVVVKRHNTRFYPTKPSDPKLVLKGNCLPGTVVDSHITSPYYFDFFLQSHTIEKSVDGKGKEKLGSAKPTHYFVIVDENKFSQDALQRITNAFCYNFSHSTSAVSYASPAYLADRLCDRVTLYLKRWYDHESDVANLTAKERQDGMDSDWERGSQTKNPWNVAFNSKMFWM